MKRLLTFITVSLITTIGATPLFAEPTLAEVVKRMDALERENAELRQMVKQLLQKEKSKKLVKEVKIVKFDPNYDGLKSMLRRQSKESLMNPARKSRFAKKSSTSRKLLIMV